MKLWPFKWQPSCLFFLCYLRLLLMMFPFTLYCRENSQWRRWRCFVGSWTSVRWRKTTRWSIPWLMLSAASWPLWRTLTQLWPPGPDCCWTPSRGRPCRWPEIMCFQIQCLSLDLNGAYYSCLSAPKFCIWKLSSSHLHLQSFFGVNFFSFA